MNEVITLIHTDLTKHDVFCSLRSVGYKEFYEASTSEYRPELKFVLADYLDYNGAPYIRYISDLYRVIRVYRIGQALEITVGRASAEEVRIYG